MAKQLLIDATRGKATPSAPWVPYAGVHCAHLIGAAADRYFQDPGLIAEGIVSAARTYHADGIPLLFDLSVEAESLGCELEYWPDNVPSVRSHPCEKEPPQAIGTLPAHPGAGPLAGDFPGRQDRQTPAG